MIRTTTMTTTIVSSSMSELPFDRRELLHHLPELLEGKEPVLATPAVKRAIAEDPECQLLIRAAAETAIALDLGMSRMRSAAPEGSERLRRSMEQVKRSFARRMVDVFWDTAMAVLAEATQSRGWQIDRLHDRPWTRRSPVDIAALAEKWSAELRIPNLQCDPIHASIRNAAESDSAPAIRALLDACVALCGSLEGVAVARAQSADWLEAVDAEWGDLVRRSSHGSSKSACLSSLATRRMNAGALSEARDHTEAALHWDPSSVSALQRSLALSVLTEPDGARPRSRAGALIALIGGPNRLRALRSVGADQRLWSAALPLLRARRFDDDLISAIASAIGETTRDVTAGGGSGSAAAGPAGAGS